MLSKRQIRRVTRLVIRGLPLAAIAMAALLKLTLKENQLLILFVLIWLQVFFVSECYLVDR